MTFRKSDQAEGFNFHEMKVTGSWYDVLLLVPEPMTVWISAQRAWLGFTGPISRKL